MRDMEGLDVGGVSVFVWMAAYSRYFWAFDWKGVASLKKLRRCGKVLYIRDGGSPDPNRRAPSCCFGPASHSFQTTPLPFHFSSFSCAIFTLFDRRPFTSLPSFPSFEP